MKSLPPPSPTTTASPKSYLWRAQGGARWGAWSQRGLYSCRFAGPPLLCITSSPLPLPPQGSSPRQEPASTQISLLRRALLAPGDATSLSGALYFSLMPALSRVPLCFPEFVRPSPQDWELQSNQAANAATTAQSLWAESPPCFSGSPT